MKPKKHDEQKSIKQDRTQVAAAKSRGGGYASGKTTEPTKPKKNTGKSTEKTRKPV